eukprot:COSAG03_NODE_658_length_6401_cov_2.475881_3_plen_66_part_00
MGRPHLPSDGAPLVLSMDETELARRVERIAAGFSELRADMEESFAQACRPLSLSPSLPPSLPPSL